MDLKENDIAYVGNKPSIRCNVIMLSSKDKSDLRLVRGYDGNALCYDLSMSKAQLNNNKNSTISYHHLYITSNEEIKEGDWYIFNVGYASGIKKAYLDDIKDIYLEINPKKIIATTDKSLKLSEVDGTGFGMIRWSLPQPSQQFIEKYVEEYNKGNIVTEVLVEVEILIHEKNRCDAMDLLYKPDLSEFNLKSDSKNQITIRKVRDNWSREEVVELCKSAYDKGYRISSLDRGKDSCCQYQSRLSEWIKENL